MSLLAEYAVRGRSCDYPLRPAHFVLIQFTRIASLLKLRSISSSFEKPPIELPVSNGGRRSYRNSPGFLARFGQLLATKISRHLRRSQRNSFGHYHVTAGSSRNSGLAYLWRGIHRVGTERWHTTSGRREKVAKWRSFTKSLRGHSGQDGLICPRGHSWPSADKVVSARTTKSG